MAGDFGVIARTISADAEAFVVRLDVPAGAKVLDVACGTGNLAIPLARLGAVVTGVDIATNLVEQARARAAEEGVPATFDEGDAEQLPYADASFDVVVTMFGAMFAPRPEVVASELARVLKPGGRLAMANWNPGSFTGKMFRTTSGHVLPPPGIAPPVLWGDEATVRERLEPYLRRLRRRLFRSSSIFRRIRPGLLRFSEDILGRRRLLLAVWMRRDRLRLPPSWRRCGRERMWLKIQRIARLFPMSIFR
jgi:SAM-dependent methyltransferase